MPNEFGMKLLEVKREDRALVRKFLELPLRIYKDDPKWIRPLDKDIESVFDPGKNKFWRHGKAIRWVLLDDQGLCIGRVAAFVNKRTAHTEEQPTGGMGFFECIDDQKAANLLFEQCRTWLVGEEMEAMDGPINFGDRNAWWGLLVDGFHPPVYQMNYNLPYYVPLFENYGFQMYFKQFVLYRHLQEPAPPKFVKQWNERIVGSDYSFRHMNKRKMEPFVDDFLTIYNKAWGGHSNFKKMKREQAAKLMKSLKPILADELAWFGYHKDEPVGFFIMIPDMNQVFKHFKGKLGWWQKARTWWMLKWRKIDKCYGIVYGVVPEHQGKGVNAGLIKGAANVLHPQGHWGHMEMVWIGDFNPKMLNLAREVGGEVYKTYHTMRFLFDREKEFKRLPLMQ